MSSFSPPKVQFLSDHGPDLLDATLVRPDLAETLVKYSSGLGPVR